MGRGGGRRDLVGGGTGRPPPESDPRRARRARRSGGGWSGLRRGSGVRRPGGLGADPWGPAKSAAGTRHPSRARCAGRRAADAVRPRGGGHGLRGGGAGRRRRRDDLRWFDRRAAGGGLVAGRRGDRRDRVPRPLPAGDTGGPGPSPVDRLGCRGGGRGRWARGPARPPPRLAAPTRVRGLGRHGHDSGGDRGLHGPAVAGDRRPGAGAHGGRRRAAGVGGSGVPVRGRRPGAGAAGRGALDPGPVHAGRRRLRGAGVPGPTPPRGGGQPTRLRRAPPSGSTRSRPSPDACREPSRWTSSCSSWPSR